jgi:hypothetical protein
MGVALATVAAGNSGNTSTLPFRAQADGFLEHCCGLF